MSKLLNWLDSRTDYRRLLAPIRRRVLPNGPSWWYTSASCLLWLFVVQMVTGLLLMSTYSPSTNSAWASVHFIEQSPSGAFLRGVHYFAAQGMIILFGIHVIRVLLSAAFRAPRELIWVTGLLLLPLMIVWAITGNPLSGSQKGVAQIEVEGNIIGSTPIVGPIVQRLLIGGDEVGHLTLTHLYFLHVGLMPIVVIALLVVHIGQVYRHGLTSTDDKTPGTTPRPYWPFQTFRNMVVLTIVLAIIGTLAWRQGAPLDAPADPTLSHAPRPEWYFRSLFELRRYFTGDWEFIATMIIPGGVLLLLLAVPFIDRLCSPRTSALVRGLFVVGGFGAWAGLTYASFARDWQDQEFQVAEQQFHDISQRALTLAGQGRIPPSGAITLLREDAKTQGPELFVRHCASCHSFADADGHGIVASSPSAPNLYGFGTYDWVRGFLDPERIASEHYLGNTAMSEGDMVSTIVDLHDGVDGDDEGRQTLVDQLNKAARALSAEAQLPAQAAADEKHAADIAEGSELIAGDLSCTDCHRWHDNGDLGSAPDLTGYGSREWLGAMIANPEHERFYADNNDRMPAFASDVQHSENNMLTPLELRMLVEWMRGEWYEPAVDENGDGLITTVAEWLQSFDSGSSSASSAPVATGVGQVQSQ